VEDPLGALMAAVSRATRDCPLANPLVARLASRRDNQAHSPRACPAAGLLDGPMVD
jgi:hypothetical protein